MKIKELPSICNDHPKAQIKHEWNRNRDTFLLTGASIEYNVKGSDQYFCTICGKELCSPEEYEKRLQEKLI